MPRGAFACDLEKYYRIEYETQTPSVRQKLELWTCHFGFHCVATYRLGQWAFRFHRRHAVLGLLPRLLHCLLNFAIRALHHVELNVVGIGPGFYIGHASGIFIGAQSVGENLSITHNVTIGVGHSGGKEGKPHIGDNVWIGTGAVVAGAIHVGNNVTISPGTFLSRSIPEACLVGGNPGRVLANNYNNQKLFPPEEVVAATRAVAQEPSVVPPVAACAPARVVTQEQPTVPAVATMPAVAACVPARVVTQEQPVVPAVAAEAMAESK